MDPVLRRQQQLADKVDGLQPHIPANIGQTLSGQLGTGPVLRQENPLPIALGQPRHNTAVRPHSPPHLGIAQPRRHCGLAALQHLGRQRRAQIRRAEQPRVHIEVHVQPGPPRPVHLLQGPVHGSDAVCGQPRHHRDMGNLQGHARGLSRADGLGNGLLVLARLIARMGGVQAPALGHHRRTTRRSPPRSRPAPARIPDPWKSQRHPPLGSPAAAPSCASTHPVWKAGPPDRPRPGAASRWAPGSAR